jgi:prepilin-type N-terminal cleavage/methylation domain-containing protein
LKKETGFTLIELLITLSMIGFVITAVYTFYLAGLSGWQRALDQTEYQQSARIAIDKIVRELTYANEISLHKQGQELRFKKYGDSRTLRFRLVGPQLVFDVYPTTSSAYYHNVVALGITEMKFIVNDNRLIEVTIGAGTFNPQSGKAEETLYLLASSVYPRNLPPVNAVAASTAADVDTATEAQYDTGE